MYDKEFLKRVSIQQVCSFFNTGAELKECQEGTPEERHQRYTKSYLNSLLYSRDIILSYDRDTLNEYEKNMKTEEIYRLAIKSHEDLVDLAFEMGFRASLELSRNI